MSFNLSEAALNRAIEHLCTFGDTDVFPHLPELEFLSDFRKQKNPKLIATLRAIDLESDENLPEVTVEALAPKGRYSFRITHQLSALDNVLFLAAVVQIGDKIEALRQSPNGVEAFAYRFDKNGEGSLFLDGHTYKDWLNAQRAYLINHPNVNFVIATDIADFYARINFHRLENLLDGVAPGNGAAKYIKSFIKTIRAKQSFGVPVGGAAARILAELVLVDTDTALKNEQIFATRFVDDFRIFVKENQHPYDAISFLAQHLAVNEGLSLNSAKTNVFSRKEFLSHVESLTNDIADQAQGQALDTLTANIYFDDEPNPDDIRALCDLNLIEFLEKEVARNDFDLGRIKVIFRALRIAKPIEAVDYVKENFSNLVVFARELVLLMEALQNENPDCFTDLTKDVISAILQPPASSVPVIRVWLLELFVRNIVPLNMAGLKQISDLPFILDKRQLNIIRGLLKDQNYFRQSKTAVGQLSRIEQFSLVIGAKCLPKDEFNAWLSLLRRKWKSPFDKLFLKWLSTNKT